MGLHRSVALERSARNDSKCLGADYKALSAYIQTRTPTQIRTHLQKYLLKLEKNKKKEMEAAGQNAAGTSGDQSASTLNSNGQIQTSLALGVG